MYDVKIFSSKSALFETSFRATAALYMDYLAANADRIEELCDVKTQHFVEEHNGVLFQHEFIIMVTLRMKDDQAHSR